MGVEFIGSRWHVGAYIIWRYGMDLLPSYGLECAVLQEARLLVLIYEVWVS